MFLISLFWAQRWNLCVDIPGLNSRVESNYKLNQVKINFRVFYIASFELNAGIYPSLAITLNIPGLEGLSVGAELQPEFTFRFELDDDTCNPLIPNEGVFRFGLILLMYSRCVQT